MIKTQRRKDWERICREIDEGAAVEAALLRLLGRMSLAVLLVVALLALASCVLQVDHQPKQRTVTKLAIGGKGEFRADGSLVYDNEKSFGQAATLVGTAIAGHQLLKGQESNNAVDIASQKSATKQAAIKSNEAVKLNRQNISLEKAKLEVPAP